MMSRNLHDGLACLECLVVREMAFDFEEFARHQNGLLTLMTLRLTTGDPYFFMVQSSWAITLQAS